MLNLYDGQMLLLSMIPTNVASAEHYEFINWHPLPVPEIVTQSKVFTSMHRYVAATVHFNTNGGEAINDIEVDKGSKITGISNPRHKDGIFVGWYSDSGLTTSIDLNSWTMPNPAVETTLYAKWDKESVKRIVSYVVVGGTANFSTVTKVLRDSDGWASSSGSFTLAADDVPTVTNDSIHEGKPVWTPSDPVGVELSDNATFTATFEKKKVTFTIIEKENVRINAYGDLTVGIGDAIGVELVPDGGYAFGYHPKIIRDLRDQLGDCGVKVFFESQQFNNIYFYDKLLTNVTVEPPTAYPACDYVGFRVIFCEKGSGEVLTGFEYQIEFDDGEILMIRDKPVTGGTITGLLPQTKINIVTTVVPEGFDKPDKVSYTIIGDYYRYEACVIYVNRNINPPEEQYTLFEIHQTVTGDQSDPNRVFMYDISLTSDSPTPSQYIKGSRDLKFTVAKPGVYKYKITPVFREEYGGYTMDILSGELSGTVDTSTSTENIINIKYVKGSEDNGIFNINAKVISAYKSQRPDNNPDQATYLLGLILKLSKKLNGKYGDVDLVDGQTTFKLEYVDDSPYILKTLTNLPECDFEFSVQLPSAIPSYVTKYVKFNGHSTGHIPNTHNLDLILRMLYPTGNLKVHTYNAVYSERHISVALFYPDGTPFDAVEIFGAGNFNGTGVTEGVIGAMIENNFTLERIPTGFKYKITLDELAYDSSKISLTTSNIEGVIGDGTEIVADIRCEAANFDFGVLIVTPPETGWTQNSQNHFVCIQRFTKEIPQDVAAGYTMRIYKDLPTSGVTMDSNMDMSTSAGYMGIQYQTSMILQQDSIMNIKVMLHKKDNEQDIFAKCMYVVPTPYDGTHAELTLEPQPLTEIPASEASVSLSDYKIDKMFGGVIELKENVKIEKNK